MPSRRTGVVSRFRGKSGGATGEIAPPRRTERHPALSESTGDSRSVTGERAAQAGIAAHHSVDVGSYTCGIRMCQNCLRESSSQNLSAVHGASSAIPGPAILVRTDTARSAAAIIFMVMVISFVRLEPRYVPWREAHGARLMARDLMQLGSPRNSPDGLAATGQGIGAGYGPDRWRDCVDAKAGITGAPLKMRRNREADKTLKMGADPAPAAKIRSHPPRREMPYSVTWVALLHRTFRSKPGRMSDGELPLLRLCSSIGTFKCGCSASRRDTVPIQ